MFVVASLNILSLYIIQFLKQDRHLILPSCLFMLYMRGETQAAAALNILKKKRFVAGLEINVLSGDICNNVKCALGAADLIIFRLLNDTSWADWQAIPLTQERSHFRESLVWGIRGNTNVTQHS